MPDIDDDDEDDALLEQFAGTVTGCRGASISFVVGPAAEIRCLPCSARRAGRSRGSLPPNIGEVVEGALAVLHVESAIRTS